ncbi:hypothetical protein EVAR_42846_1 [Eumeta japonica]|uniref:Uncharacterized protein n=1 Tax=Eumeta variegata TaxID=151549 RepID=A0A4C1WJ79_EUMVA|nr:hypothetical protein EVAR_42846_1 [Eumeta japonica]
MQDTHTTRAARGRPEACSVHDQLIPLGSLVEIECTCIINITINRRSLSLRQWCARRTLRGQCRVAARARGADASAARASSAVCLRPSSSLVSDTIYDTTMNHKLTSERFKRVVVVLDNHSSFN